MGLLDGLFGRKTQTQQDTTQQRQFDEEWTQALRRFGIVTGLGQINLVLQHPKTGQPMAPHEGLNQSFLEWKPIEAPYDRRALLFDLIANTVGKSMNRWQIANYLIANRRPDAAWALLEEAQEPEMTSSAHHIAAAKALLNLGRTEDALIHAKQAFEDAPNDVAVRTLFADALHMAGQTEEAHAVYPPLANTAQSDQDSSSPIAGMFAAAFSQETGTIPSPVMAVEIGGRLNDPAQIAEFWRLGELEFYDSAYFRMHHAYHLVNSGEMMRGFAKLMALVNEMPWLREPSFNLLILFEKLDPTGQKIMPEAKARLRQTIEKNGWTTEGMHRMTLGQEGSPPH